MRNVSNDVFNYLVSSTTAKEIAAPSPIVNAEAPTLDEARTIANEFIKKNQLPPTENVTVDASGNVVIDFSSDIPFFAKTRDIPDNGELEEILIILPKNGEGFAKLTWYDMHARDYGDIHTGFTSEQFTLARLNLVN